MSTWVSTSKRPSWLVATVVLGLSAGSSAYAEPAGTPSVYANIYVAREAAYRVTFKELFGTEPTGYEAPVEQLGLRSGGVPVPIWVEDGGDGRLGPGDWIEFVGRPPRGEVGHLHEHAIFNVYKLSLRDPEALRMRPGGSVPVGDGPPASLSATVHFEDDRQLLRFASRDREEHELWYWTKLSQIDREPFRLALPLDNLDRSTAVPPRVRVNLRGWSKPRRQRGERPADHRVEIAFNGEEIGHAEWDQQEDVTLDLELPLDLVQPETNELSVRVPRRETAKGDPLIDVVALNWVELSYPRWERVGDDQEIVQVGELGALRLTGAADDSLLVFGADGLRVRLEPSGAPREIALPAVSTPYEIHVSPESRLAAVDAVEVDRPSFLASDQNQADYIIITHPKLFYALTPLVDFHRSRGLKVTVVEIQDVYDEFNHGVVHPRAIKDFLRFAYRDWRRPAPRFVLLAGDASWDPRNQLVRSQNYDASTFVPRLGDALPTTRGEPYFSGPQLNDRNLIPTWGYLTLQGRAAGDNWFVDFEGDDAPEMAIGRFPVNDYWDALNIAEKTVAYVESPEPGPWRTRALLISDGAPFQDRITDAVAGRAEGLGLDLEVVKPDRNDPTNDHHRERLHEAFNRGQYLVHFVGHGGRFIWRTAPADFEKNRDLFTLDDLDVLESHRRLPIVLAMTCYSGPFDHPGSDSIGEKFLRLEDRGAIAVIASSWRSTPNEQMSEALVAELAKPGTLGQAFVRAKRAAKSRHFAQLYNLLGDPALPLLRRQVVGPGSAVAEADSATDRGVEDPSF